jgi:hypothetical protein
MARQINLRSRRNDFVLLEELRINTEAIGIRKNQTKSLMPEVEEPMNLSRCRPLRDEQW